MAVAKGSYGVVTFSPCGRKAIKCATLFEANEQLSGCNLNEAIIAAKLSKMGGGIQGLIQVDNVELQGGNLYITMTKGDCTLESFVRHTPFSERMDKVWSIFTDLVYGLHTLHEDMGLVHCDFKPGNIVLNKGKACIIDFGSSRHYKRAVCKKDIDVWCTFPFCAPEALQQGFCNPMPSLDAYSLGATLFFYIYKDYLFDPWDNLTKEDALKQHLNGSVEAVLSSDACPMGVPDKLFQIMMGLLHPDPIKRTSIHYLYRTYCQPTPVHTPSISPKGPQVSKSSDTRDKAIEYLFTYCGERQECFALAVSIMDRYEVTLQDRSCTHAELSSCLILAELALYPDVDAFITKSRRKCMMQILQALAFQVDADTLDWILLSQYGHPHVDYEVLKNALKTSKGVTTAALQEYISHRDYMVIDDD